MSGKKPIFYSALMLTGVNLLLRLISTSFQVYLSGRIGAAGIGLLQLVLSVGMLAMTAGMGGIRTATMYLTAEEVGHKTPRNLRWVLGGCFTYSLLFSGTVSILLYFFAPVIAGQWIGDSRTVDALRLFALFLPVTCACGVMTGYFTARGRIGTLASVEIAEQLCSMGVTVALLALWAGDDPALACQSVIAGSGVGACLTLISLAICSRRIAHSSGAPVPMAKRLCRTALPLALADDVKAGLNTTENLMVPKRLSLCSRVRDPLAAFGIVTGMVFPVLMFPAAILFSLAELLIPEMARCRAAGSQKRIRYLTTKSLRVSLIYACLFAGLMFLLADPLCITLYGSAQAGQLLKLFSLLIPMLYCDAITDAIIKGLGEQTACVRYNILTSAMDVALLFIMLPHWGMNGYFISFLITHLLNFILSLRRLLKITKTKLSFRTPALMLICCGLSLCICSFVPSTAAKALTFPAVLISLMVLMNVVGKRDFLWLWKLIKKTA